MKYKPQEEKIYPIHCERCEKDLKEKWKSEKEMERNEAIGKICEIIVKGILIIVTILFIIWILGWLERLILGGNIFSEKIINWLGSLFHVTPVGD